MFKKNKSMIIEMLYIVAVIIALFYVANVQKTNGRIEMCNELNGIYLETDECMDFDEYQNLLEMQNNKYTNVKVNMSDFIK